MLGAAPHASCSVAPGPGAQAEVGRVGDGGMLATWHVPRPGSHPEALGLWLVQPSLAPKASPQAE